MGILVSVGAIIYEGLSAAIAYVGTAVTVASTAVTTAITDTMLGIAGNSSIISAELWADTTLLTSETLAISAEITTTVNNAATALYLETSTQVNAIKASYNMFLEAIHYDTLLKIHEIAYIVSGDYRVQVNKIYGRIAEVSEALGLGAQFINLALRNARAITLDVNASIGRFYDIGEIAWMKNLSGFLESWNDSVTVQHYNETGVWLTEDYTDKIKADTRQQELNAINVLHKASVSQVGNIWQVKYQKLEASALSVTIGYTQKYKNNPGQIFHDIDTRIIKPHVDEAAEKSQIMFSTVEGIVNSVSETVEDIQKVNNSLDKFTQDLPASIRKHIEPYVNKITQKVDNWIDYTYKPKSIIIDKTLNVLIADKQVQESKMSSLYDRLKKPGTYLKEIDTLSREDRENEEAKVFEVANRTPNKLYKDGEKEISDKTQELTKVDKALKYNIEPLPTMELEKPSVSSKPLKEHTKKESWFVGDY